MSRISKVPGCFTGFADDALSEQIIQLCQALENPLYARGVKATGSVSARREPIAGGHALPEFSARQMRIARESASITGHPFPHWVDQHRDLVARAQRKEVLASMPGGQSSTLWPYRPHPLSGLPVPQSQALTETCAKISALL